MLHMRCFEGRQPSVQLNYAPWLDEAPSRQTTERPERSDVRRRPLMSKGSTPRASSPPISSGISLRRSQRQATMRLRAVERRVHQLSFACREDIPWHQQTSEREIRVALASATREGFQIDRHYREGLDLVMEGRYQRIKVEQTAATSMMPEAGPSAPIWTAPSPTDEKLPPSRISASPEPASLPPPPLDDSKRDAAGVASTPLPKQPAS